jgi:arylsulfatase
MIRGLAEVKRPQRGGPAFVAFAAMLAVIGLAAGPGAGAAAEAAARKPNIVLIMADDMGFSDLGCYGSEIATPNLDRIAAGGLRFTQFYNTARCCPTRASLLTGLYPHQAGVGHMVQDRGQPAYRGFLNDRCVTIAEALKTAGYRTYMSGKWHVGEDRPHWPVDRGFDRSYALISGATNYFRLDPGRKMARDDQPIAPGEGWYITDAITASAVSYLEGHRPQQAPFFLYVAYTSPHWPLHAWPEDIAKYRGRYKAGWDVLRGQRHERQIALGIVDARWPLTPRDARVPAWENAKNQDDLDLRMAVYAAQIDRMDQGIGKVLAKIAALGMKDNTLVLFLADNGGCAEIVNSGKPGAPAGTADSFLSYGVGWANASNTPFRLYKHWVHEGGIATPLVAYWPATIKTPAIVHQPGHLIDIMATCCDVAGAEYPKTHRGREITPLEGKSLLPIFLGKERAGHEAIFWEHEGNRAVRQGKWKLVALHGGPWELYDLEADRTEMNNLAAKQPEKVAGMSKLYDQWAKRAGVVPWQQLTGKPKAAKRRASGDRKASSPAQ